MQEDKIFNNSYGEHDMTENPVNFRLESSYEDSMDPDDKIHYEMMMKDVDRVILESEYCELNKVTPEGVSKKLNKIQINKVFYHVIEKLGRQYTKIEIFGALSDYFDIFPNKFYSSLSNKYKDELMLELDRKYNIFEKKKMRKLF